MSFRVQVADYDCTMEELFFYVKQKEVQLTDVMLSDVVKQFELYDRANELAIEETSDFLHELSQLLLLKSKALLPLDSEDNEQEQLQEQVERFEQYQQLKLFLDDLEAKNERSFARQVVPHIEESVSVEEVLEGVSLDELSKAFYEVLQRFEDRQEEAMPEDRVEQDPWTVEQKIEVLTGLVKRKKSFAFLHLFEQAASKLEVICTFLALLELLKQRVVQVHQEGMFGEMMVERL